MLRTRVHGRFFVGLVLCGVLVFVGAHAVSETAKPLSIEGTYRLVWRDLPDGKKLEHPEVLGIMTYTKEYRNFTVYWKDARGKSFSISYVATYRLTEKAYTEKSVYHMVNDEIGGKGAMYDLSGPSGTSPVSVKDGRTEFQLPLYGEPAVVFDRDKFTASRPGAFVDHWEKVK
jgi:hypothetical protein